MIYDQTCIVVIWSFSILKNHISTFTIQILSQA